MIEVLDESGVSGSFLHYGLILTFFGGALLSLLYFWWKGQLNFDEEAKHQMLNNDETLK